MEILLITKSIPGSPGTACGMKNQEDDDEYNRVAQRQKKEVLSFYTGGNGGLCTCIGDPKEQRTARLVGYHVSEVLFLGDSGELHRQWKRRTGETRSKDFLLACESI